MRAVAHDESGIALVMVLGVLLVLTIAFTIVITLGASGGRHAQRSGAEQKAFALAEAGVNNALAQLSTHYPSSDAEGSGGSSLGAGPLAYDVGTVSWAGTYASGHWQVSGTGTVKNPAGGADLVRTATATIDVIATPAAEKTYGLFSGDPGASCVTLGGGTSANVPVYVASCLTLSGNTGGAPAKIWEPNNPATVTVEVGGLLTLSGGMTVGTLAAPVKSVAAGSCSPSPCGAPRVYAQSVLPAPAQRALPEVDAQELYDSASWSGATCTGANPFDNDGVRNNSKGTINPSASWLADFNCSVTDTEGAVHELQWTAATKQLRIEGSVFIDGNFGTLPHNGFQYSGDGTIYVNGTVYLQGVICGPGSTWTPPETCGLTWDQNLGQLLLVAANAAGPQVYSYLEPNADGVNNWDEGTGTTAWNLLDDGVRQPSAPSTSSGDRIRSTITAESLQDLAFPNNQLVYDDDATYTFWVYGRQQTRTGWSTLVSVNETDFAPASEVTMAEPVTTAGPLGWYQRDVTALIQGAASPQAALDGLRLRFKTLRMPTGSATASEVYAVYLAASVPGETVLTDPAFVLDAQAKFEAGAWAIGNFSSSGGAHLGGSVYVDRGTATITGGGNLKAFVSLPSGAPTAKIHTLGNAASHFG